MAERQSTQRDHSVKYQQSHEPSIAVCRGYTYCKQPRDLVYVWIGAIGDANQAIHAVCGCLVYQQHRLMEANQLSGTIPPAIGSLTNLQSLYVARVFDGQECVRRLIAAIRVVGWATISSPGPFLRPSPTSFTCDSCTLIFLWQ